MSGAACEDVEQHAFSILAEANAGPVSVGLASDGLTPYAVLVEFLYRLSQVLAHDAEVVLALHGSLLLQRWYGPAARPAADLDVMVFRRASVWEPQSAPAVERARHLCVLAVTETTSASDVEFFSGGGYGGFDPQVAVAPTGHSQWEHGATGDRFFIDWRLPGSCPLTCRLQIDLVQAGEYTPDDLGVGPELFTAAGGSEFTIPAYSQEAMLAAKVSWLVRGLRPPGDGFGLVWSGEPKDLFDAHLLATAGKLRADVFRRAMLAIGDADALHWNALDQLFAHRRAEVPDSRFANWPAFAERYPGLAPAGPATLLAELADRLEPLLGDLYPAADLPLLAAVTAQPDNEMPYLVYADWLDDRGDPRGSAVRAVAAALFRSGDPAAARDAVATASPWWLRQLFGTTARLLEFCGRNAAECDRRPRRRRT